jgi:hypothetical protein
MLRSNQHLHASLKHRDDAGESTLMGSIYVFWAEQNRLWQVEIEEGFSLEELLVELGTLEEKTLGEKVHGR